MMKIHTVWEDERGRLHLAEAEIIRVTENCFWIEPKNRGFRFKTKIRRKDLWYSFSAQEALRLYILEKKQELKLVKDQIEEAEILLEIKKEK